MNIPIFFVCLLERISLAQIIVYTIFLVEMMEKIEYKPYCVPVSYASVYTLIETTHAS